MSRLYTLAIILSLLCSPVSVSVCLAQQSQINGVISVHNSLKETGTRQYISNAQVSDDYDKAQPVITNDKGVFTLIYVGLANSKSVSFNVLRNGYEVVNISELNAVTGQLEVVKISMAPPGKIAQYRAEIYKVGKTEAEKYLNRMLAQKKSELAKLNTELSDNKLSVRLLEQEIRDLDDKLLRVQEQAEYLAKRYAVVNLDDASPFYQEAFKHFERGRFDSALVILNKINYLSTIDQLIAEREKLNILQSEMMLRDSVYRERYKGTIGALTFKMDLHRTRLEYDSVNQCYEYLLKIDSTNTQLMYDYASFNSRLRNDSLALAWYDKILATTTNDSLIAVVKTEEGIIYQGQRKFELAKQLIAESVALQTKLFSRDSIKYGASFVRTQVSLGNFYLSTNNLVAAEQTMKQALAIQLNTNNDYHLNEILTNLSSLYSGLGNLNISLNNFREAEASLLKSIDLLRKKDDGKANDRDATLSGRLCVLGGLYAGESQNEKAVNAFSEAGRIANRLYAANQKAFGALYADVMLQTARFELGRNNDSAGITKLRAALAIGAALSKADPKLYELNQMIASSTLANYHHQHGRYDSAALIYAATDRMIRKYMTESPDVYQPTLAYNYSSWANTEMARKHNDTALLLCKHAEEIFSDLFKSHPEPYKIALANALYTKATIYQSGNLADSAITFYSKAIALYESVQQSNTQIVENTAYAKFNQGAIYEYLRDFEKAATAFVEARIKQDTLLQLDAGKYEPMLATTLFHLGVIDFNRNDILRSSKEFSEAITIQRRLAATHKWAKPMLVSLLFESVKPYMGLNDFPTSEAYMKEALSLQRELVKDDDTYLPYLVTILGGQGNMYRIMGRYEKATDIFRDALTMQRKLLKKDTSFRPFLVDLLFNCANAYASLGKTDSALLFMNDALKEQLVLTRTSSSYMSFYAMIAENKAHLMSAQGKTNEAVAVIRTTLDMLQPLADSNSIYKWQTIKLKSSLAWFYNIQNRFPESFALGREVIREQEARASLSPATEDANLVTCYIGIAAMYSRALQPDSTLNLYFKAEPIQRKLAEKSIYGKSGLVNLYAQISAVYNAKADFMAVRRYLDSAIHIQEELPAAPAGDILLEQLYAQYVGPAFQTRTNPCNSPHREKLIAVREKIATTERALYETMLSRNEYDKAVCDEGIGNFHGAEQHYGNAVNYLEVKRTANFSDSMALANTYFALIRVVKAQSHIAALDTLLQKAIHLTEANAKRDSLPSRSLLAGFYFDLGNNHWANLPDGIARQAFLKALRAQEWLYQRDSNTYKPFLVGILHQVANVHWMTYSTDSALTYIYQAIRLQEQLVKMNEQFRPYLLKLHLTAGEYHIARGEYIQARPLLETVMHYEHLLRQPGQNPLYPQTFATVQHQYANLLRDLGELPLAIETYNKAIANELHEIETGLPRASSGLMYIYYDFGIALKLNKQAIPARRYFSLALDEVSAAGSTDEDHLAAIQRELATLDGGGQ